jgi:TetR/AcrR family transcriptional regulator
MASESPSESVPSAPKDGRRERTAKAIKESAAALFSGQGVTRTTVDEIAERAGVSVGSVYVHFGSKDALYVALVEEALTVNARYVAEAPSSDSPLQRIFNAGDAYVRFALENPMMFRLISMQDSLPTLDLPELEPALERSLAQITGRLRAIGADLTAAIEVGELQPIPVGPTIKFLWATWSAVISLTQRTDRLAIGPDELHATLLIARNALARGLGAPIAADQLLAQEPLSDSRS